MIRQNVSRWQKQTSAENLLVKRIMISVCKLFPGGARLCFLHRCYIPRLNVLILSSCWHHACSLRFRTQKTTQRPQWVENLSCFLQSGRCLCWRQAPRQAPRASNGGAPRLAWRLPHTFGGRSSININCRRALRSVPGQAARTTTSRGAS